MESIWKDADFARGQYGSTLEKDEYMLDALLVPQEGVASAEGLNECDINGRVIALSDGDFHVCAGPACPHVYMDSDRQLFCQVSGLLVGTVGVLELDARWTGRSTTSSNPDDIGGTPIGGWVKRRDMFAASVDAFNMAESYVDVEVVYNPMTEVESKEKKAAPKRGALCVDEVREQQPAKRTRVSKKSALSLDTRRKMQMEAITVITKLITRISGTASKSRGVGALEIRAQAAAAVASNGTEKAPDPRLQNVDFVRTAALKRMLKNKDIDPRMFSMDAVHNLCVYVNQFVKSQRKLAEEFNVRLRSGKVASGETTFTGKNLQLSAVHIVQLWAACCMTPYIARGTKSGDSFRPFAAGVLYTLKRGLKLKNGMEIIPSLPELASQLPCLRSQQATSAAKQLQSSSHRGVCSLHRSISSIDQASEQDQAHIIEAFRCACLAGQSLVKNVRGS